MTATIEELTTPLTVATATDAIYAAIAARGIVTTDWTPGAPTRTIIAALAIVLAALSNFQAQLTRLGFLALSSGAWLRLVGRYVYGVIADEGSFASGPVTISNASGFVYSFAADELVVSNSGTGKAYRNSAPFSIGAGGSLDVPFVAVELGTASTSSAGDIDTVVTAVIGLSCTNAAALVGTDPEEDEAYRLRCSEKTGALSPNGPTDAYRFFATSTLRADGTAIGVTRVRTVADGFGNVAVYLATPSGGVTGPDVDVIDAAIQENAVPLAVTATTSSATPKSVAATYEVWVDTASGLSAGDVQAKIDAALASWVGARPIGGDQIPGETTGRVYKSLIEVEIGAACTDAASGRPFARRVIVTVPAGDVDVAAAEAPVAGTITGTVHMIAGGL